MANWTVIAIGIATCIAAFVIRPLPQGMEPSSVATTGLAIAGLYFLIKKYFSRERTDALAVVSAEVGVVFCTVVLVTGPLWARPVWGIWWTWDVRLTSTLVLWLIYISYLMLRRFSTSGQTPVLAAALAVFGALDVPLVYFSIWIFRTQHPQPVIGGGGSIDPRMLHVLLINWLAFLCFAGAGLLVPLSPGNSAEGSGRNPGAGSAARTPELTMNFLYAAYAATWIIHIAYLGILVRRYSACSARLKN